MMATCCSDKLPVQADTLLQRHTGEKRSNTLVCLLTHTGGERLIDASSFSVFAKVLKRLSALGAARVSRTLTEVNPE